MLSNIAIIGCQNVGKSTLFNRLSNSDISVISSFSGSTRDRQYNLITIINKKVVLIDTGSSSNSSTDEINKLIMKQTELAIEEANLILFVVDITVGLTIDDEIFFKKLRKSNKNILLIINKIDCTKENNRIDFYKLGFREFFEISAKTGLGLDKLCNKIYQLLPEEPTEEINVLNDKKAIKVTFIGRPNVGKSTLINNILGKERIIVHDEMGTTHDSIEINFNKQKKDYILIDTAGIRRKSKIHKKIEQFSVSKSLQAIISSDVVVFIFDASNDITDQDLKILSFVIEQKKAMVFAINKWDKLEQFQKNQIKSTFERKTGFVNFIDVHFISALYGTGINALFKSINKAYSSYYNIEINTSKINKILELAVKNCQPPLIKGLKPKLRYAHIGKNTPLTIIIHGSNIESLSITYRRYLERFFRESLKLSCSFVTIILRNKNINNK